MSSAVVSTSAALGRPFVFDANTEPEVGSLTSGSRASLDRTAEGGCPHINLQIPEKQGVQESPLARVQSAIKNQPSKILPARVTSASRLDIRPAPEMVSSGISALDTLTGGLPRGCLTEICGPASSGRTTLLLAAVAAAARRGEFCAVVDASDALDPHSAAAAGVELDRLLWVRCGDDPPPKSPRRHPSTPLRACPEPVEGAGRVTEQSLFENSEDRMQASSTNHTEHRLEQVQRATDLLLESGGFGLIVLDLGDLAPQAARHIPLTTWFRFRRAVEYTPTILLAIEQHPIAGSCSSLLLQLGAPNNQEETMMLDPSESSRAAAAWDSPARQCRVAVEKTNESHRDGTNGTHDALKIAEPVHAQLLTGLNISAELIRSRLDRKPARSVAFASKTAWAR